MTDQTPTTAPVDLDEQTATDVARLAQLTREIKERTEHADEIKARLRERLAAGRKYTWQGREVLDLGKTGVTFDAKLAAAVIDPALLPQVSVSKPDADLCRAILPPNVYAACCKPKAAAVKTL